ncbi:putrescine ABC transporter permease PotI, partial [Francisella tularensis subsp. holarctica]|nr:putrescine ABC transporter permease PotI [Francisella tularensis subsp. holarctica]
MKRFSFSKIRVILGLIFLYIQLIILVVFSFSNS